MESESRSAAKRRESTDRWSAAIAYLSILCWLPYFLLAERPLVLYHAKQGILLFLLELVGALFLAILDTTVGRIPFLGLLLMGLLQLGFLLIVLLLSVLGFSRALASERLPLPWIGRFAESLPDPPFQLKM